MFCFDHSDGDAVRLRPDGVRDFERMRPAKGSCDAFLYALDLLELDGVKTAPRAMAVSSVTANKITETTPLRV